MVCMLECLACGSRLSGLHDGSAATGRQGGAAAPWAMTGSYPVRVIFHALVQVESQQPTHTFDPKREVRFRKKTNRNTLPPSPNGTLSKSTTSFTISNLPVTKIGRSAWRLRRRGRPTPGQFSSHNIPFAAGCGRLHPGAHGLCGWPGGPRFSFASSPK